MNNNATIGSARKNHYAPQHYRYDLDDFGKGTKCDGQEGNTLPRPALIQSMKVFIKPKSATNMHKSDTLHQQLEIGQGDGGEVNIEVMNVVAKSPRTLFFGG